MHRELPPKSAGLEPTDGERRLSGHIFAVSAGLIGVCLTVIGLFSLMRVQGRFLGIADNLIALNAMVFLSACVFAYFALRVTNEDRWRRLERIADSLFLLGIFGMVLICGLIAYELV